MEIVRCLLLDGNLLGRLWDEAARAACVIMNIRSSKCNPYRTLEELFSRIKPDMSKLRIFGSPIFVHKTKPSRGKLDYGSRKCVHLSYDDKNKGYRCFDPTTKTVIVSKDVHFLEEERFGPVQDLTDHIVHISGLALLPAVEPI
jgi:hypothetical protein